VIAKSPLTKSISLIPIVGYLILWSEGLKEFLTYSEALGDKLFLSLDARLYLLYSGSWAILVGWLVYAKFCPDELKLNSSYKDYFSWLVTDSNTQVVKAMLGRGIPTMYKTMDEEGKKDVEAQLSVFRADSKDGPYVSDAKIVSAFDSNYGSRIDLSKLTASYFVFLNMSKTISRWSAAILFGSGSILILIPSAEVLIRVILKIFFI